MPNDRAISRPKALSAVLSFPTRWLGIVLLATVGTAHGAPESAPLSEQARQADVYYQQRQDAENVRKALTLVRDATATNPQDYEDWWRVAMFTNFLARRATAAEKSRLLDEGIEAGKKAVVLSPNRVEGHFWLGANYGLAAEAGGFLQGLHLVGDIRSEMQTVLKLNPEYQEAGRFGFWLGCICAHLSSWVETSAVLSSCSMNAKNGIPKTARLCSFWQTVIWPSVARRTRASSWRAY